MVNRLDRTESHGNGGEFPEIRHQPGVRVRGKTSTRRQFAAEILQFFLGDAAFEIGPGIHAGGGVSLEINYVASTVAGLSAKEVVESHFVKCRG